MKTKKRYTTIAIAACAAILSPISQANTNAAPDDPFIADSPALCMNMNAVLSEDAQAADKLAASVEDFLHAVVQGEITQEHITAEDQQRHSFFMKALRNLGMGNDQQQPAPLILKSFSPNEGKDYLITVAFMRSHDSGNQIYRIIEFYAYQHNDGFRYKSPFKYNTRTIDTYNLGQVRFHLQKSFNEPRAKEFVEFKNMFENLVGNQTTQLDYYCFDTLDELLRAHGIVYDCTKCNWLKEDLGFLDNNGKTFITGTGDERYLFEYLVDYMAAYCDDNSDLYPPFVYGIATYFGDYGLSGDDMPTLKAQFRAKLKENPDINFLDEFNKGRKSSVNRHFSFYVISAFLCEQVASKHGHQALLKLAHSGRNGEQFFTTLEQLLGIDENGFDQLIKDLIKTDNKRP